MFPGALRESMDFFLNYFHWIQWIHWQFFVKSESRTHYLLYKRQRGSLNWPQFIDSFFDTTVAGYDVSCTSSPYSSCMAYDRSVHILIHVLFTKYPRHTARCCCCCYSYLTGFILHVNCSHRWPSALSPLFLPIIVIILTSWSNRGNLIEITWRCHFVYYISNPQVPFNKSVILNPTHQWIQKIISNCASLWVGWLAVQDKFHQISVVQPLILYQWVTNQRSSDFHIPRT